MNEGVQDDWLHDIHESLKLRPFKIVALESHLRCAARHIS